MLTVHHLGKSQSERIVWLCEELEIPYVLKRYDRVPPGRGMGPPEYKALHALGTAPIITDGDVVLPESGAIMEYIIGKYGGGRLAVGPDAPNFADYLFWFHFANASFLPSQTGAPREGADDSPRAQFMRARAERAWTLVEDPTLARGGCLVRSDNSQIDARFESRVHAVLAAALGEQRAPERAAAAAPDADDAE